MRVLGIGNRLRRDDGVGPWVVEALRGRLPQADLRVLGDDGFALLEALAGSDAALVVDAVQSGAPPGTVHRLDAAAGPLPAAVLRCSTHLLGVAEAVELARALGELPRRLTVYGIEGADFSTGEGLSPAVAAAAAQLVDELATLLERPQRQVDAVEKLPKTADQAGIIDSRKRTQREVDGALQIDPQRHEAAAGGF